MEAIIRADFIAPGVKVYLDDITVFSRTRQDHLALLEKVFERMLGAGIKITLPKCSFMQSEVKYLRYNPSGKRIQIAPDRIQAVSGAPGSTKGSEIRGLSENWWCYEDLIIKLLRRLFSGTV
jgi:hypothetical protein